MRILAIGDIHGCLTAFDALLATVQPGEEDLLVTLGDYVDRGPNSCGVLERLLELRKTHRLTSLCGNHEQMMLEARHSFSIRENWLTYGGDATLLSYAKNGGPGTLDDVPADHWSFLETGCHDWFETERYFFVHAGAAPDLPLEEQPIYWLRWEKFYAPKPHISGKLMICGHTRQLNGLPCNVGHAICIDTWVYGRGWLTCLDARSGHYWQANEAGAVREGEIADLISTFDEVDNPFY